MTSPATGRAVFVSNFMHNQAVIDGMTVGLLKL